MMYRIRQILVLTLGMFCYGEAGFTQSFMTLGINAYQQGDLKMAERMFYWAIAVDSTDAIRWMNRAQVRRTRGNLSGAYSDLKVAAELGAEMGDVHFMLALVAFQLGKYPEAVSENTLALELGNSYGSQTLLNRAQSYTRTGQNKEALEDLTRVIERKDAHLLQAYLQRGQLYLNMNEKRSALTDLKMAAELDPNDLQLMWDIGRLAYETEEYTDALSYYSKVIDRTNEPQAQMLLIRGEVFEKLKNYEAAIVDYSRVIDMGQQLAEAHYLRGQAKARSGNLNEACPDWQKAAELGHTEATSVIVYNCK